MTIEIGFDRKHGEDESVLVFLKTQEAGCAVVVDTLRGECAEFVQGVIERLEAAEKAIREFFVDYDADDTESANHIIVPIEAMRAALAGEEKP
jgi:hypothetical protein